MKFCAFCGSTLNDNETCSCQETPVSVQEEASVTLQAPQDSFTQQTQLGVQPPQYPPYPPKSPYTPPHPSPYPPNPYAQSYPPSNPPVGYPYYPPPQKIVKKSAPGQKMIKVTGILMTIFGGLETMDMASYLDSTENFGSNVSALTLAGGGFSSLLLFELISALATLGFGIAGIVLSKNRAKASTVTLFGVVLIALRVVIFGLSISSRNVYPVFRSAGYVNLILSSVLPILYIVGGSIRKKNAEQ